MDGRPGYADGDIVIGPGLAGRRFSDDEQGEQREDDDTGDHGEIGLGS